MTDLIKNASDSVIPVGAIVLWGAENVPEGWLELNGQTFSVTENPELAKLYPGGKLPDYRGRFPRGWAHGSTVDPDSGRAIGSLQDDTALDTTAIPTSWNGVFLGMFQPGSSWSLNSDDAGARVVTKGKERTVNETRPKNIAVMFIIKTDAVNDEVEEHLRIENLFSEIKSKGAAAQKTARENIGVDETYLKVGDYGWGASKSINAPDGPLSDYRLNSICYATSQANGDTFGNYGHHVLNVFGHPQGGYGYQFAFVVNVTRIGFREVSTTKIGAWYEFYTTKNTTKDSNGNLKGASPIVKLFMDKIELNEESEGVEMEHIGTGHYLIKGVVGFNADGAWGINNGFVIPQDHNGKNMVLIDYKVRQDGDIELFVFHQQNVDMPERFQNKRIKHFDEEGVPVYYENYEPCDVPESRWIDMRVEMPPSSIYNLKQAEAEAKREEEDTLANE